MSRDFRRGAGPDLARACPDVRKPMGVSRYLASSEPRKLFHVRHPETAPHSYRIESERILRRFRLDGDPIGTTFRTGIHHWLLRVLQIQDRRAHVVRSWMSLKAWRDLLEQPHDT